MWARMTAQRLLWQLPPHPPSPIFSTAGVPSSSGVTIFALVQLKAILQSFHEFHVFWPKHNGALKEAIPFKDLLFSPDFRFLSLWFEVAQIDLHSVLVQCIDSWAITRSSYFLQFTNFLSNYLEQWQERCRWQPRGEGGGGRGDPRNDLILSTSNWQATLFDILSPENYPWHDLNRVPVKNVPKIVYTFYSFS